MIQMICDQGCFTTAENKISKRANPEFMACLLILDQVEYVVANVLLLSNKPQYTRVTTMGKVMMVVKRIVCAS